MNNPLANLPARGERAAPTFDDTQPEELERYFSDLQAILDRHQIVDDQQCKLAALKYLKFRTESLWKTTDAWVDQTKTYDEFKAEVFKLYPGASGDRTYTMQDLDRIVGQYARIGIKTAADLGEYYRQFILISRYLISRNRLSTQEQSRTFLRGFQPHVEAAVRHRLQLKFIDHHPDDPYNFADIYEAASYVLTGTNPPAPTQAQVPHQSPNPTHSTSSPDPTAVKIEALTAAITSLGDMLRTTMQNQLAGAKPRGAAATGMSASGGSACNFCGETGHYIRECEAVTEFIKAGKCKRGADSKVILPSGAMVPRDIPGTWLRDRIEEWHRRNPGQKAAMFFEVTAIATAPANEASGLSYFSCPTRSASRCPGDISSKVLAYNRQTRPRPEVVIDSQPPFRSGRAGQGDGNGGAVAKAAPQAQSERPPQAGKDSATKKGNEEAAVRGATKEPTHPYAAIPDAIDGVVPGRARPAAPPAAGKPEPGYSHSAKIHDPQIAQTVYERVMEVPITVTQRELLSLSPEVRARVADVTIKKRVPKEAVAQAMIEEITDSDDETIIIIPEERHIPPAPKLARTLPPDAAVMDDPYEAYLRETSASAAEPGMAVAAESDALRAILPVVDGQDRVEAILDPGCQIVAMSEEVANALALPYDPAVRLNMMSANGGVDQSLGLARNVPFLVGEITVYLQVHVLRDPAYDILLGRPFDVLTRSVVRNFTDGNQNITINDPNTGRQMTIPTIPRGSFRFAERRAHRKNPALKQDF
jgi:hypothetical protein